MNLKREEGKMMGIPSKDYYLKAVRCVTVPVCSSMHTTLYPRRVPDILSNGIGLHSTVITVELNAAAFTWLGDAYDAVNIEKKTTISEKKSLNGKRSRRSSSWLVRGFRSLEINSAILRTSTSFLSVLMSVTQWLSSNRTSPTSTTTHTSSHLFCLFPIRK